MTKAAKTTATPEGAGTDYTQEATASANANGKASATPEGGDPVNSPVIGNPGENRPDMGYDYGVAGNHSRGAPIAATQALQAVTMLVPSAAQAAAGPVPGSPEDTTEYAELVRARYRGHYDGVKEVGVVFSNDRNLPTYPEDPNSWFEDAEREADWEAKEKAAARRRR